ncbi:MAG: CoA pyrophosphatase [Acidimicrobiales bacterium]|jgi:8-oxo-dGTP pyrophosphatase MutT (NUDIX family)
MPAPWATLPAAVRTGISLHRVVTALTGVPAPRRGRVAEPWRHLIEPVSAARPAAVLVSMFEEGGEARVVLTVRSDRLRSHQGEVAFPGGRLEGDEGVVEAALREAFEEVGLQPGLVNVVAQLTAMPTISSDTVMTPVVATLETRPSLTANPGEVERVFDVALSELAADGVFHEEWWSAPGRTGPQRFPDGEFPVWFFEVAGETVWGATARTLVELICLVLGVDVPPTLRTP